MQLQFVSVIAAKHCCATAQPRSTLMHTHFTYQQHEDMLTLVIAGIICYLQRPPVPVIMLLPLW